MNVSIITLGPVDGGKRRMFNDILPEIQMLKAAVLYGDDIEILSGAFRTWEALKKFQSPDSMGLEEKVYYSIHFFNTAERFDHLYDIPDDARVMLSKIHAEMRQFRSESEKALSAEQMERLIDWIWPLIVTTIQHLILPELPTLLKLIDQKRLRVGDVFTAHSAPPDLMIEYGPGVDKSLLTPDIKRNLRKALGQLSSVGLAVDEILSRPGNFPMLDAHVSSLVHFKKGAARPSRSIRHTTTELAKGLFAQLPIFEKATLNEIVQIRSELDPYVRQSQVTLGTMATQMKDVPAEDFPNAVEEAWLGELLPEIHALKEAVRRNRYFGVELLHGAVTKPEGIAAMAGGLVLGATQSGLASLISPGIMAAVPAISRAIERRKLANQLEQHRFFFLYKLNE